MEKPRIYLDNNATTVVAPEVKEAMLPFLTELYGNPSSLHRYGAETRVHIAEAYDHIYRLIEARDEDSIIINSCGTEGNNTVLQGVYHTLIRNGNKREIITTNIEHPSINTCLTHLAELGVEVKYLPVNKDGYLELETLAAAISDKTALVSVMWANNETGVINPIEEIAALCHKKGVLFHTDATQAMAKLPVSVKSRNIDFLTYSGHKFHAPKGVGALYIKAGIKLPPLLYGGEQMGGLRGGTHNMPGIAALGAACKIAVSGIQIELTHVKALRDRFETDILESIPDVIINGKGAPRTPNTCNIIFKGVEGEAVLWDLNEEGIAASTGSACASGDERASYVLSAMKLPPELTHSAIRFSLSRYTTAQEIERALDVIRKTVRRLRSISTSYK
ncbi:MAG: cysteine desulfurase [Fibrobacteres bacterium]|nr:cysteine desulfurase [Fibrobacterota bacterium]